MLCVKFWESPALVMGFSGSFVFLMSIYGFYITERELVPWVYDFETSVWYVFLVHADAS